MVKSQATEENKDSKADQPSSTGTHEIKQIAKAKSRFSDPNDGKSAREQIQIKKLMSESDKEASPFDSKTDSEASSPLKVESSAWLEKMNTKELSENRSVEPIHDPEQQE